MKSLAGFLVGFVASTLATSAILRSSITITSPTAGSVNGAITIVAATSGEICSVAFSVDGQPLSPALASPPWTVSWSTLSVANGSHQIRAMATDADGVVTTASVNVTVNNVGTPPSTSPSPPLSCSAPDPYARMGGGLCVFGHWLPPPGRAPFVPVTYAALAVGANVVQPLIEAAPAGHIQLGTVIVAVVGLPNGGLIKLVSGGGSACAIDQRDLTPFSPVSTVRAYSYGASQLPVGHGLCVVADRSLTLSVNGSYLITR
jgi:hypothetical protein